MMAVIEVFIGLYLAVFNHQSLSITLSYGVIIDADFTMAMVLM